MAFGTLILNAFSVRAAPCRFIRRCCCVSSKINVPTNIYGGWRDIVALILPSRAGEAIQNLDRFTASASLVELLRANCAPQRYQEVGMIGSLIWLAFVGLITILYVTKLWILDTVLASAQPIRSWASGRLPRILWCRSISPSEVLRTWFGLSSDDQSAGCGCQGHRRRDSGRTTKDWSRRYRCNGCQSRRDDTDFIRNRRR